MATEIFVRKFNQQLIPADGFSLDALETLKPGTVYKIDVKSSRKYKFLQKAFVLVNYAFGIWEPVETHTHKGIPVQKNISKFRDDLTIMAGFYDVVAGIKGTRYAAKSWSFSEMPDDEDFSRLYSALIDVIIQDVISGYKKEDLDDIVNNIITGFA